jgi:Zn-dependent protease
MATTSTLTVEQFRPRVRVPAPELVALRPPAPNRYLLHLVLFVLTVLTTTLIGMRYMYDFDLGQAPLTSQTDILPYEWAWNNLDRLASGLPFSLTLISILLAHEFGHYAACRWFGVDATLPFLFPAPTLSGTFGAVIRIRSRIQSRAALMVIGTSGPIAGFAVAIATTCYGLLHSKAIEGEPLPSVVRISAPPLMNLLRNLLLGAAPDIPPFQQMVPHPVLVASWIGILITAVNLIPAGQLDGGHIVYALSPRAHRICHHVTIGLLLYLGTVEWLGWLFWAFLLLLPGMRHPRIVDKTPLSLGLLALAPVSLAILALAASTQPVAGMSLSQVMLRIHWGFWIR